MSRPPVLPSTVLSAALAAAALAVPGAQASDAAPPDAPVVLDPTPPIAVSASGADLAWIRPAATRDGRATLVVRDGDGTSRVVGQTLPANVDDLVIGRLHPQGPDVAIVATQSSDSGIPHAGRTARRGTLWSLPLDGSAAPERLAVSKPGTDLASPGLLRGRLSFARRVRLREGVRWTLRRGTASSSVSTLVSRGDADQTIDQTTPVSGGRIAYVTSTRDRVSTGAALQLRLIRPGDHSKVVSRTDYGGASESGFGPLTPSAEGGTLTASRWTVAGSHPHDLTTWTVPGGRVLGTAKSPAASEKVVTLSGDRGSRSFEAVYGSQVEGTPGLVLRPAG